jgi:hypothetical protein
MPNGTERFENCKQLLEYQNFLLLRDIYWLSLIVYLNVVYFFQHYIKLYICGSLRQLFSCIVLSSIV